jgi:inorganic triphosphatase YgiF
MPQLGAMHLGSPERFLGLDRYLDTAGGRLAAARWACRLRRRSRTYVVSLKGPPQAANRAEDGAGSAHEPSHSGVRAGELGGALHRRPEIEGPATARLDPGEWPPSAARNLVLELSHGEALREQLALMQRRTQRSVYDQRGRLATLSLDRVVVIQHGEAAGRLWCVELELDSGAAAREKALARLLGDLLAVAGLSVEPRTKLERAMALIDRDRR